VTKLQPVEGEGGKIFPATFANGAYATEKRRILDAAGQEREVDCVLLDSVQSQSNRAEEALKNAIERGKISLPLIEVEFNGSNEKRRKSATKFDQPGCAARLTDAILRDSEMADGTGFSKSEFAKRWGRSNLWNATAVYELCPTALVFGMWGSPEKPGGLGAKFERTYVSEIVAVDVERVESREGFRIDPLGSRSAVLVKPKEDGSFGLADTKTKDALPPAKINHGNIPFQTPNGGLRCRYAEQVTVVSLGALRKLRFPVDGRDDPHRNDLGRTVLAAIGLCAGIFASEAGTSLRSRCHLWPVGGREWELLERPGQETRKFRMNGEEASILLGEAIKTAKRGGLAWMEQKLTLRPTPELVELVRQSQELAAKEKGEGAAE